VCLAPRAIDGVGKLASGEPEVCFDPAPSSHFVGCAAAAPGARARRVTMAANAATLVPWCAVLALRGRRLARQRRRTGTRNA
jgi:hypothetical protein